MKQLKGLRETVVLGLGVLLTQKLKRLIQDCEVVVTILVNPRKQEETRVCSTCGSLKDPNETRVCKTCGEKT